MRITTAQLQEDLDRILDQVLETGRPVEIERRGRILRIEPLKSKLDHLKRRDDYLLCDPEDLVHLDWTSEWRP